MDEGTTRKGFAASVLTGLATGAAAAVLMGALMWGGVLEPMELKSLDWRFHQFSSRQTPSPDIVIVSIDQNSIDYLKNRLHILWKWPRDVYGYVVGYVAASGAKAVLLDFDFSDPDINRAEFEEGETDEFFGSEVEAAGNVVLMSRLETSKIAGAFAEDSTDYDTFAQFALNVPGADTLALAENVSVVAPITPIMAGAAFVASANVYLDVDGVIRQLPLLQRFGAGHYASGPLALAMTALGTRDLSVTNAPAVRLADREVPVGTDGQMYLNWYGPGGPEGGTYTYLPIADVLLSHFQSTQGMEPVLPASVFAGKIVLIGSNAASLYDLKPTPFSDRYAYPGVEILATAVNNLLDGSPLRREGRPRALATLALASVLMALTVSWLKEPRYTVAGFLAVLGGFSLYAAIAFTRADLFVNMIPPIGGITFAFVGATLVNYLTEGKQKALIKKAFLQYTSPALLDEIVRDPTVLKLGGEKRDLTVLFSDIRGFTSISEKMEPEQLIQILNEYLTPMTDIVFKHGGILDKYIGDAVMAIFGAPLRMDDHAGAACGAALDMVEGLGRLREQWAERGLPEFIRKMNIGVGLNSGPVSVGNMGSLARFDYTVIGDNVNLTSRLEGTTKFYGVNIIVSEFTYARVKDRFVCRELDYIKVVGKDTPIRIYELLARRADDAGGLLAARAARFGEALALYRGQRYAEASQAFTAMVEENPADKTSAIFIERCAAFIEQPPPEGWDGVYERRSK